MVIKQTTVDLGGNVSRVFVLSDNVGVSRSLVGVRLQHALPPRGLQKVGDGRRHTLVIVKT